MTEIRLVEFGLWGEVACRLHKASKVRLCSALNPNRERAPGENSPLCRDVNDEERIACPPALPQLVDLHFVEKAWDKRSRPACVKLNSQHRWLAFNDGAPCRTATCCRNKTDVRLFRQAGGVRVRINGERLGESVKDIAHIHNSVGKDAVEPEGVRTAEMRGNPASAFDALLVLGSEVGDPTQRSHPGWMRDGRRRVHVGPPNVLQMKQGGRRPVRRVLLWPNPKWKEFDQERIGLHKYCGNEERAVHSNHDSSGPQRAANFGERVRLHRELHHRSVKLGAESIDQLCLVQNSAVARPCEEDYSPPLGRRRRKAGAGGRYSETSRKRLGGAADDRCADGAVDRALQRVESVLIPRGCFGEPEVRRAEADDRSLCEITQVERRRGGRADRIVHSVPLRVSPVRIEEG
eukprot:m.407730 g.407730  ORF g.407730 m.407730 type:complete len:406 (+) comp28449_c0_seq2:11320-12537(+)